MLGPGESAVTVPMIDRLTLLLVGILTGSAATLLVIGISQIGSDPDLTGQLSSAGTVLAAVALAVTVAWVSYRRRHQSR